MVRVLLPVEVTGALLAGVRETGDAAARERRESIRMTRSSMIRRSPARRLGRFTARAEIKLCKGIIFCSQEAT